MEEEESRAPRAVFMAFGTRGDVYPLAAVAAALASDQLQYKVVFITHAAHENLSPHLLAGNVTFIPVSSQAVVSAVMDHDAADSEELYSLRERFMGVVHQNECVSAIEKLFEDGLTVKGDFIAINFFALEGWHLAELFNVRCLVVAPYVVPYSAPSSFESLFEKEHPLLHKYLQEPPNGTVSWNDVMHWMWPLFSEKWAAWRSQHLMLSPCPFTDPVTGLPTWHDRPMSPLILYGFSKEVVDCPGHWPSNIHVCGFWFLPLHWQFSCSECAKISSAISSKQLNVQNELCASHAGLQIFLDKSLSMGHIPIYIGLSSIGSMGYLRNPLAFLLVIKKVVENTEYRIVLATGGYEPLNDAIIKDSCLTLSSHQGHLRGHQDGSLLFDDRVYCTFGSIPFGWLFPRCKVAIHHGGSGSTAAALLAGIPQIVCPFVFDQFYWAERMSWLGVAPNPLRRNELLPDNTDELSVQYGADTLLTALQKALSPEVKKRATNIAEMISKEDGIGEALKILKEKIIDFR